MDHRQLLKKYIAHVVVEEGSACLDYKEPWANSPEFTDEEWAELKKLEREPLVISAVTHSCSCHAKNAGPCGICKELGCEVWDFNEVATLPADRRPRFNIGVDRGSLFIHDHTQPIFTLPKPEKPEGDDPRAGHEIPPLM